MRFRSTGLTPRLATHWLAWLCLSSALSAHALQLLPPDPTAQGYRVDNEVMVFKEHLQLPQNLNYQQSWRLDEKRIVTNIRADEQGDYSLKDLKKVVIINTETGEMQPLPYLGNVICLADRNIVIYHQDRKAPLYTYVGDIDGPLKKLPARDEPGFEPHILNFPSCTTISPDAVATTPHSDKIPFYRRVQFRVNDGILGIRLRAYRSDPTDIPPHLAALMQQPFMTQTALPSSVEQWIWVRPDGTEQEVPNNPGEAGEHNVKMTYLPYLNAYFLTPYAGGRPFDPPELQVVPRFARLFYADGRVERIGVPDVIAEPYARKEISFTSFYTKRGLIWRIFISRQTKYRGPLEEGYYFDLRAERTLRRLPPLLIERSPTDGCILPSRAIVKQRKPHYLYDYYFINLCEEPQKPEPKPFWETMPPS
jgi:hypothetical protein